MLLQEVTGRLDSLEDLAASNAEIRDKMAEKQIALAEEIDAVNECLDVKTRELKQNWHGSTLERKYSTTNDLNIKFLGVVQCET